MANWLGLPAIQSYRGLDLMSLPLNHAYLLVNTTIDNVGVYSLQGDCYSCAYRLVKKLRAREEVAWMVDAGEKASWRIMNFGNYEYIANNYRGGLICQEKPSLGEFGVYRLEVGACVVETEVPPVQSNLPLLPYALILLAVLLIYATTKRLLKCRRMENVEGTTVKIQKHDDVMNYLNIFRGLLMIIIIFTTSGGGGYPLINKKVGSISITDVTFNALAWTIGVHIPLAVDMELTGGKKKWMVVGKICLRSFILITLSLILDLMKMLNDSPSVLWLPLIRIGIAYWLAAGTYVLTVQRFEKKSKVCAVTSITCGKFLWKVISSVLTLMWSWILFSLVLAMLMIGMQEFANFNRSDNTEFKQKVNYSNMESEVTVSSNNIYTEVVNSVLVGDRRSILDVNNYFGYNAGLLGVLSTMLYAVIGLKAGVILSQLESHPDRIKLNAVWGALFVFIGFASVLISFPTSTNIWPIASIFLTSGTCTLLLMVSYWWTEIRQQSFSPMTGMGSNFIIILFGHLLFFKTLPFCFMDTLISHFWCLIQDTWGVVLWMVVGEILVRKNIKIRV